MKRILFAVLSGFLLLSAFLALRRGDDAPATDDRFRPDRYMLPAEPITEVPHRSVADADAVLRDDDLVLGVVVNNEARAYPIAVLNEPPERKVLNDTLGGRPLLTTWCDRCQSGIVYLREVDGRPAVFGISGQLWKDSLVMYDVETFSRWSQLLGEAKLGKRQGATLERLPAEVTAWRTWARRHPDGTVAWLPPGSAAFRRGNFDDADKFVLGIAEGQQAKAWSLAHLADRHAVNDTWQGRPVVALFDPASGAAALLERRANGRAVTFVWRDGRLTDEETGSTWEGGRAVAGPLAGTNLTRLPAVVATRKAWALFYPH